MENIERKEGKPLPSIEEERMAPYSQDLNGLVLDRASQFVSSGFRQTHAARRPEFLCGPLSPPELLRPPHAARPGSSNSPFSNLSWHWMQ